MFVRYRNYFGQGLDLIDWDIKNYTGYAPLTTYYTDFSIADRYGIDAIKDTFKRCKKQSIEFGYTWLTELTMVMNWKMWEHCDSNYEYMKLYQKFYEELSRYCQDTLTGDELNYYYSTTD